MEMQDNYPIFQKKYLSKKDRLPMEYAFILQRLFEYSQSSSDAKIQWLSTHETHTKHPMLIESMNIRHFHLKNKVTFFFVVL